jgi:glutamyl-Q tRNA(Asp) synthetase
VPVEFEQAIYEDLGWLGLAWETPVRRQFEHFPTMQARSQSFPRKADISLLLLARQIMHAVAGRTAGAGPGRFAALSRDIQASFARGKTTADIGRPARGAADRHGSGHRESRPQARLGEMGIPRKHVSGRRTLSLGDTALSRKDIPASYHIAFVVDDALQGVTDVVRGEDLFLATSLHRLLQALLDLPAPAYRHHALLRDASGQKLSKSSRAKSLRALRQDGFSLAAVQERLSSDPILAGL